MRMHWLQTQALHRRFVKRHRAQCYRRQIVQATALLPVPPALDFGRISSLIDDKARPGVEGNP